MQLVNNCLAYSTSLKPVAEVHTCEGMHLPTLKNNFFHIYPYVFCTLNLLVFLFCTSCQRPKPLSLHSFTLFNFSLNYPLNLKNSSSSTSTTLIHSGGSTTTKPRRATTPQPIPSSLSRPIIHYHLQSTVTFEFSPSQKFVSASHHCLHLISPSSVVVQL